MCSNQTAVAQVWPFLANEPPVLVDWLPWNHVFGGSFCFNLTLFHGGTFFVDDGKPSPRLIGRTVTNLREISPTMYLNVPLGYDMLLPPLECDTALRDHILLATQRAVRCCRSLATHTLAAPGRSRVPVARREGADDLSVGCHRNSASGHRGPLCQQPALPLGRPASAGLRDQDAAQQRSAGTSRPRSQRNTRLLAARRFDARGIRRGWLLSDWRHGTTGRSQCSGVRDRIRRSHRQGFQAGLRVSGSTPVCSASGRLPPDAGYPGDPPSITRDDRAEIRLLLIVPSEQGCRYLCSIFPRTCHSIRSWPIQGSGNAWQQHLRQ